MNEEIRTEIEELRDELNNLTTGIKTALAVSDRTSEIKNLIISVLLALLIVSNGAWFMYERQFETVEETTETESWEVNQDNENGANNYIGNDGDIIYGDTEN